MLTLFIRPMLNDAKVSPLSFFLNMIYLENSDYIF